MSKCKCKNAMGSTVSTRKVLDTWEVMACIVSFTEAGGAFSERQLGGVRPRFWDVAIGTNVVLYLSVADRYPVSARSRFTQTVTLNLDVHVPPQQPRAWQPLLTHFAHFTCTPSTCNWVLRAYPNAQQLRRTKPRYGFVRLRTVGLGVGLGLPAGGKSSGTAHDHGTDAPARSESGNDLCRCPLASR